MQNEKSEQELRNVILFYLNLYEVIKDSSKATNALQNKIQLKRLLRIFSQQVPVENLKKVEMYFIIKYFFENMYNKDIKSKPIEYFTEIEIAQYEELENVDNTKRVNNRLVLTGVKEVIRDKQWVMARTDNHEIANNFYDGFVTYNFKTQRDTEKIELFGQTVEKARFFKESIKDMVKLMKDGDYKPTALSYNILANGNEAYEYDAETETLTIDNSEIDIIDGANRSQACVVLHENFEDATQIMQLNIFHYDELEALAYIKQEAMKNEMKKGILKAYDSTNIYNTIAREIGDTGSSGTNFMYNHVDSDYVSVEKLYRYCTYGTLMDAIKSNYKLDKRDTITKRRVKSYLVLFLNEVISICNKQFENVKESRQNSFVTYNNMFYGYIALSKALEGQEDWEEKLLNIFSNIDFSLDNKFFKNLNVGKEVIIKRQIKELENYFKNLAPVITESEGETDEE